ncbi:MAG: hypothetical protein IPK66_09400 [Rhodospirillales bacterium]|nr:hypothetical protein [Rhodospirillales bacterium]
MKARVLRLAAVMAAALASCGLMPMHAVAATATLAPRSIPVPLGQDTLPVTVSGVADYETHDGKATGEARLTGDLASAQQLATSVLRALLDRDQRCGEHIAVREGHFAARAPALEVTALIDYERRACFAGKTMTIVPRSDISVDMLLHPVVGPRSLKVRGEVLTLRSAGTAIPSAAEGALRQALSALVSERIGELFPASAPDDLRLQEVAFADGDAGQLIARIGVVGSMPQSLLDRLTHR